MAVKRKLNQSSFSSNSNESIISLSSDDTNEYTSNKRAKKDDTQSILSSDEDEKETNVDINLMILHKILRKNGNYGVTYTSGEANKLPVMTGIYFDDFGRLALPIIESQVEQLKLLGTSKEKGTFEFDVSHLAFNFPKWYSELAYFKNELAKILGCTGSIQLVLEKLVIVETGGRMSRQNIKFDNGFGTLIIQLPSIYDGGKINLYEETTHATFDFVRNVNSTEHTNNYVAFHSEVEFELEEVTHGHLVLLIYSISWQNEDSSLNFLYKKDSTKMLIKSLSELIQPDFKLAIELENTRNYSSFNKIGLNGLEGNDLNRFLILKEINDKLDQDKQYCFSIAKTIKVSFKQRDEEERGHHCDCEYCDHQYDEVDDYDDDEEEDEYEIDENADPSSKSRIIRPIEKWYDAYGNSILTNSPTDIRFFTKIICPSIKEIFVDNLDGEEAWQRKSKSTDQVYCKYFLAMWPKKYENRILVKMDLKSYIKSTYKELLCDSDANFDQACENLEVIIEELVNKKGYNTLEYEYIYNLLESLKFTQDDELAIQFLDSICFKYSFNVSKNELIDDVIQVIKEFSIDKFKKSLHNILIQACDIHKKALFINRLFDIYDKNVALECFESILVPKLNNSNRDTDTCHFNAYCIILELLAKFKNCDNFDWKSLKVHILKLIKPPTYQYIIFNYQTMIALVNMNEIEYSKICLNDGIIQLFKDSTQFVKLCNMDNGKTIIKIIKLILHLIPNETSAIEIVKEKVLQIDDQTSTMDLICKELLKLDNQKKSHPFIQKIFLKRYLYFDKKAKEIIDFGWQMPNATMPQHPQVERFLKSNLSSFNYSGSFNSIIAARSFATQFSGFKSSYSIDIKPYGSGKKAFVTIIKTNAYRNDLLARKKQLETLANTFRCLLK